MSRIVRINTRTREFTFEDMGEYAGLGGRALTSAVVGKEVPANCHPLSADNKLVVATGILGFTNAANSGRISVGAKSPLTGGIKESNSGGLFGHGLPKLNLTGIILEDKPAPGSGFVNLVIGTDKVEFVDASDLVGLPNYEAHEKVKAKYGEKAVTMMIGPGGESCRLASTIQFSDPEGRPARSAGRGGMGAVMGSKKVKAIILDPEAKEKITVADEEKFKAARKRWSEILLGHPVTSQGLPAYGTAILINIINEAGALPTKNFRYGQCDHASDISGETIAATIEKRGGKTKEGCHPGCVIQCSQRYNDKDGNYITSGFEYETIWALGANCLIKDLDDIAALDRCCDEMGVDTIEMGTTLAVAMDGGLLEWGDGKRALELLQSIGNGDTIGKIIGNGTSYTAQALGVDRVPVVKNQSLPAYDPRSVKGIGVTYATTAMGADHTAGYAVCQNILKVGGDIDPLSKEGQIEVAKNLQIATAAVDSTGMCLFVAFAVLDTADAVQCLCDMITGATGKECTVDDFINLGVNTLKIENAFNARAGFTKEHDQLPRFFREEPLPPHNTVWDFDEDELQAAKV